MVGCRPGSANYWALCRMDISWFLMTILSKCDACTYITAWMLLYNTYMFFWTSTCTYIHDDFFPCYNQLTVDLISIPIFPLAMPCTCTPARMIYICTVPSKINPSSWCLNHPSLRGTVMTYVCMYFTYGVPSVTGVGFTLVPFIGVCVRGVPDAWYLDRWRAFSRMYGYSRVHTRGKDGRTCEFGGWVVL